MKRDVSISEWKLRDASHIQNALPLQLLDIFQHDCMANINKYTFSHKVVIK